MHGWTRQVNDFPSNIYIFVTCGETQRVKSRLSSIIVNNNNNNNNNNDNNNNNNNNNNSDSFNFLNKKLVTIFNCYYVKLII